MVLKASSKKVSARSPSTSRSRTETSVTLPVPGYTAVPEGSPFALDQTAEFARPRPRLCPPPAVESTDVFPVLYQTAKPARPLDVVNQRLPASVPSPHAPQWRLSGANKISPASAQSSSNQGQDFMDIGLVSGRVASDALIMCGSACGRLENSPVVDDCESVGRCSLELTPEKEGTIPAQSLSHTLVNSRVSTTLDGSSVKTLFQVSSASLDSGGSPAVQVDPTLTGHANNGHCLVPTHQTASPRLPVPASASQAEILLNQHFDFASYWGPSLSLTRAERFDRGLRLRGVPPEWVRAVSEWVCAVFAKYPELARLKRDQRIQDLQHQSARVQRVASDQASIESTENKRVCDSRSSRQNPQR